MIPNPERVTYFAATDSRGKRVPFGIKAKDRERHMYVIGKTGMGKSTLLENMAIQDIRNGEGFAFIDPHGSAVDKMLDYIPEERVKDVVYFAPADLDRPLAFNVMEDVGYDKRHLVVSGLMATFKKIWVDAWSARMEYILSNTLLALLEYPDATLLGVNRMYTDKTYRKKVVDNVKDPMVKDFWTKEFANYGERYTQEATPAIQNKIGQFTSNPLIRNIIGQPHSSFDIRQMMDERKILLINLSKGLVGDTNMRLLGSMLTTRIFLGAMSRAELPDKELRLAPNFYLYVDEFQNFANDTFSEILSEARKYHLNLIIAHQYVEQMDEEVRAAVFGNVGTTVAFRVGPFDAEVLETVFFPQFTKEDLVNLGARQIYLSLMIDGVGSPPFSAITIPPIEPPLHSLRTTVVESSRTTYGTARADVEGAIQTDIDRAAAEAAAEAPPPPKKREGGFARGGMNGERGGRTQQPMRGPSDGAPRAREGNGEEGQRAPRSGARPERRENAPAFAPRAERPAPQGKTAADLKDILRAMTAKQGAERKEGQSAQQASLKDALKNAMPKPEAASAPRPREEVRPAPQAAPEKPEPPRPPKAAAPEPPRASAPPAAPPFEIPEEELRKVLRGES